MSVAKHDILVKKEFVDRLAAIDADLPDDWIDRVLKVKRFPHQRIVNVRYVKTFDFEILEIMEKIVSKIRAPKKAKV